MNIIEENTLRVCLLRAQKELGEITACVLGYDERPEHWKNELGDLIAYSIVPMLVLANLTLAEAQSIGDQRIQNKRKKSLNELYKIS